MNKKRCMTQSDIHYSSYLKETKHKELQSQSQSQLELQLPNGQLFESISFNKGFNQKGNYIKDQFNANITIINKQLSNIEVDKRQILYIPTYINQKVIIKKQNQSEAAIILPQQVEAFEFLQIVKAKVNSIDLTQENQELKAHIKFLLNQIKKMQKANSNVVEDKLSKTKTISDNIIELKAQIEENKAGMNQLKQDYNQLFAENEELKNKFKKKKPSYSFSYENLKLSREVQAFFCYSNGKNQEFEQIDPIEEERGGEAEEEEANDEIYDEASVQFYNNVISNSNEIFIMKLIKVDSTVLSFNKVKRTFAFTEYFDKANVFKPYFDEEKAIYLAKSSYLYIVISNLFFLYDHSSHSISQLPSLNKEHSKGCLFLFNNRLLCFSGMESESVEEFQEETAKWNLLPSMSSPRAEASYLVLNSSTLFSFFGYNYRNNEYLSSIEYLDLASEAKKWKCYSKLPITIRKHSLFASSKGIVYLLGGKTDDAYNSTSLQFTFTPSLKSQGFEIQKIQDDLPKYIYESNFYEYVDIGTGDMTKIAFDEDNNIHLVNTEDLHHTIITYI